MASVEADIARIGGSGDSVRGLFVEEHPGLRSLRERLVELQELAAGIEQELKVATDTNQPRIRPSAA
jgi:hypothetical protein